MWRLEGRKQLERAVVDRARLADLRRIVGAEAGAKLLVSRAVPGRLDALLLDFAEVDPIGRGDHAAGHGVAIVADVAAAPGPIAALRAGRAGRVRARLRA